MGPTSRPATRYGNFLKQWNGYTDIDADDRSLYLRQSLSAIQFHITILAFSI